MSFPWIPFCPFDVGEKHCAHLHHYFVLEQSRQEGISGWCGVMSHTMAHGPDDLISAFRFHRRSFSGSRESGIELWPADSVTVMEDRYDRINRPLPREDFQDARGSPGSWASGIWRSDDPTERSGWSG
jgi:hypothetical protein